MAKSKKEKDPKWKQEIYRNARRASNTATQINLEDFGCGDESDGAAKRAQKVRDRKEEEGKRKMAQMSKVWSKARPEQDSGILATPGSGPCQCKPCQFARERIRRKLLFRLNYGIYAMTRVVVELDTNGEPIKSR